MHRFQPFDDLAIRPMSPGAVEFQQLLNVCSEYGVEFDVGLQYNAKKCYVQDLKSFQRFTCQGNHCVSSSTKYLGHSIADKLEDDADM